MSTTARILYTAIAVTVPFGACALASDNPYASTYHARSDQTVLIRGGTILTGAGDRIDNGDVLLRDGRIEAVGHGLSAPAGARVIDAAGRWVTPGLIDAHSHLGVYPSPDVSAHRDDNEATSANTAEVWAEHGIWPQDPGFATALAGGVTTLQILPGSNNLIGGRGVVVKNIRAVAYQDMKYPGALQTLKMACGENPKRVYGGRNAAPSTRMGNVAGYRQAFADAQDYKRQWQRFERAHAEYPEQSKSQTSPPRRNLRLESLVAVLDGEIRVHVHCYRADEMVTMLDLASEFGFKIAAFHHAVEAYKIADRLAEAHVCAALWADWWGFKLEAFDGIQENVALVDRAAGGCAIVHSDSEEGVQRLNQEAAKAMARGRKAGLDISPERAITWITSNPAKALAIDDRTGTLESGKSADVVIWNRDPFSVYTLADEVFLDGVSVFDRKQVHSQPRSDFLLGQAMDVAQ